MSDPSASTAKTDTIYTVQLPECFSNANGVSSFRQLDRENRISLRGARGRIAHPLPATASFCFLMFNDALLGLIQISPSRISTG